VDASPLKVTVPDSVASDQVTVDALSVGEEPISRQLTCTEVVSPVPSAVVEPSSVPL